MTIGDDFHMSTARPLHASLRPAYNQLRDRPSRTWSLIMTFYGDAVIPRGGSLWLGTLLNLFEEFGIGAGVVRTSMSRLASDGWLERTRVGRNSFYRLTARGRETFRTASQHIYHPSVPAWDGKFRLILTDRVPDRDEQHAVLQSQGFGSPTPGVWIAPSVQGTPPRVSEGIEFEARLLRPEASQLASLAWGLSQVAKSYQNFLKTFSPLSKALDKVHALNPVDATKGRLLLIHEYRRVVLRDPILPQELLPADWPGDSARALCRRIYPKLVALSEPWLNEHGLCEDGRLPAATRDLYDRFR